ncbi:hypothetical protein G3I40_22695, partial [Streptomyces sp. SID14478]|nr:hypothetical protein [Streptomyces sp. SID14478]
DRLARAAAPEEAGSRGKPRAASGHFAVPAAATVAPAAPARKRLEGGFDFFGTSGAAGGPDEDLAQKDLADVVGDEALAEQRAADRENAERAQQGKTAETAGNPESTENAETAETAEKEVIDLTAHDETEQIDVGDLRSAMRA